MTRVQQASVLVAKITLNAMDCPHCGVVFAIPDDLERRRRDDHASFYCPNGHSMVYDGPSAAEREAKELREKLDRAERRAAALDQSNTRLANDLMDQAKVLKTTRATLTRTKNRIHAGVCPVCNRHFTALERHMHTKHPNAIVPVEPSSGRIAPPAASDEEKD